MSRHHSGTSDWFLTSPELEEWLEKDSSTLFCSGIAGVGKSVLASVLIDYLQKKIESRKVAVGYVYCIERENERQTAESLLRSILRQVTEHRPMAAGVWSLYDRFSKSNSVPAIDDISNALGSLISDQRLTVYIAVDALDECHLHQRSPFLTALFQLQAKYHVKILVFSRSLLDIEAKFSHCSKLSVAQPRDDILRYIADESRRYLQPWTEEDEEGLPWMQTVIADAADGM